MQLTEKQIEAEKEAAEKIGVYGKVTLIACGGILDIVTEQRERIRDGNREAE